MILETVGILFVFILLIYLFSVWIVFLLWVLAEIEEEIYETKYNIFNV